MATKDILNIAQIIIDKKGLNVMALDIKKTCGFCDYLVIAEGSALPHVKSIAKTIVTELKQKGVFVNNIDGQKEGDWIVLDFSDVMVHIFLPEIREKYQIERLWSDSKIIDLRGVK